MRIVIGNPVTGDDFFGREGEQEEIWRKLETSHLLMLAPRRIGKTSLMMRLCETADHHAFSASLTSFAPCADEMGCIRELIRAIGKNRRIADRFRDQFVDILKRFKITGVWSDDQGNTLEGHLEFQGEGDEDWRKVGEVLAQALSRLAERHVVCVDELPVFVLTLLRQANGSDRVRNFLNWFRNIRQTHHQTVRWILAGSIGMDTIAARLGMGDTINDLAPFPLGAFSHDTADQFLARLAESYQLNLEPAVRSHLIQRVGWSVPFYLALLFDKVREQGNTSIDPRIVDVAYETLLSPTYKMHFDYWRQRLHEELGQPEAEHALTLLGSACRDQRGASRTVLGQHLGESVIDSAQREQMLRYLLDVLENDGYLVQDLGRYRFRLEWLRQYWLRRVV